jgi:hypothetical protein
MADKPASGSVAPQVMRLRTAYTNFLRQPDSPAAIGALGRALGIAAKLPLDRAVRKQWLDELRACARLVDGQIREKRGARTTTGADPSEAERCLLRFKYTLDQPDHGTPIIAAAQQLYMDALDADLRAAARKPDLDVPGALRAIETFFAWFTVEKKNREDLDARDKTFLSHLRAHLAGTYAGKLGEQEFLAQATELFQEFYDEHDEDERVLLARARTLLQQTGGT